MITTMGLISAKIMHQPGFEPGPLNFSSTVRGRAVEVKDPDPWTIDAVCFAVRTEPGIDPFAKTDSIRKQYDLYPKSFKSPLGLPKWLA